jgi:hypothetical protein
MAFGNYLATAPRVLTPEEEAAIAAEVAAAQGQPAAAPPPPPEGQAVAPGATQTTQPAPAPAQEYVAPPPDTSYGGMGYDPNAAGEGYTPPPASPGIGATQTTQPQYQASPPAVSSERVEDGAVGLQRHGYPSAQPVAGQSVGRDTMNPNRPLTVSGDLARGLMAEDVPGISVDENQSWLPDEVGTAIDRAMTPPEGALDAGFVFDPTLTQGGWGVASGLARRFGLGAAKKAGKEVAEEAVETAATLPKPVDPPPLPATGGMADVGGTSFGAPRPAPTNGQTSAQGAARTTEAENAAFWRTLLDDSVAAPAVTVPPPPTGNGSAPAPVLEGGESILTKPKPKKTSPALTTEKPVPPVAEKPVDPNQARLDAVMARERANKLTKRERAADADELALNADPEGPYHPTPLSKKDMGKKGKPNIILPADVPDNAFGSTSVRGTLRNATNPITNTAASLRQRLPGAKSTAAALAAATAIGAIRPVNSMLDQAGDRKDALLPEVQEQVTRELERFRPRPPSNPGEQFAPLMTKYQAAAPDQAQMPGLPSGSNVGDILSLVPENLDGADAALREVSSRFGLLPPDYTLDTVQGQKIGLPGGLNLDPRAALPGSSGEKPPTWAEAGPAMRVALTGQTPPLMTSDATKHGPPTDADIVSRQSNAATGLDTLFDKDGNPIGLENTTTGERRMIPPSTAQAEVDRIMDELRGGGGAQAPAGGGAPPGLDAQGNVTNTPQAATTPQPASQGEIRVNNSGGGYTNSGGSNRGGYSNSDSYDYPRSSSKRGSSVGQMFADDGEEMDLNDFLKDYNGNGEVDEEDRRTAGKRFASYKKKRGRKGKTSTSTKSGFSNVPQREDSPIRTKTLNAIKTSTRKSGKR